MNVKKYSILTVIVLFGILSYFALHESPEQKAKRADLETRAKTEILMRISLTPEFDEISDPDSAEYYITLCAGSDDWNHRIGVMEAIDVTSPSPKRVDLNYCVNTENWQIRPDNELAKQSSVDDSAILDAKRHCARLTDADNIARDKVLISMYGNTFLQIIPSSTDVTTLNFSCMSVFNLTDRPGKHAAVWELFPNSPSSRDTPQTAEAVNAQQHLTEKATPYQYSVTPSNVVIPPQYPSQPERPAINVSPAEVFPSTSPQPNQNIGDGAQVATGTLISSCAHKEAFSTEDLEDGEKFVGELQSAVRASNSKIFFDLVDFPLRVNKRSDAGLSRRLLSAPQAKNADISDLFSPTARKYILGLNPTSCLTKGSDGFTMGGGMFWFHRSQDGEFKLFALNQ